MPDGIPYANNDGLWRWGDWETATRSTRRRSKSELMTQTEAIRMLLAGRPAIYAVELADGIIKIGHSQDFAKRRFAYDNHIVLAFRPGTADDEREIHRNLVGCRARKLEYYHPTAAVLAVVNDMRAYFNLPPLEAAA